MPGLKTLSNNPGVDLQSGMTGLGLRAPIINMRIKKGENKMDVSIRKLKLRKYSKGLNFSFQFLTALVNGGSLEAVR